MSNTNAQRYRRQLPLWTVGLLFTFNCGGSEPTEGIAPVGSPVSGTSQTASAVTGGGAVGTTGAVDTTGATVTGAAASTTGAAVSGLTGATASVTSTTDATGTASTGTPTAGTDATAAVGTDSTASTGAVTSTSGDATSDTSTSGVMTTGIAAGGSTSTGVATETVSTTGTPVDCSNSPASTSTRPQLDAGGAAQHTIASYLAAAGPISAPVVDNWNPTAGVGDPAGFTPNFTVAKDGSGTHSTVQAALDATSGSSRQYILVKAGTYTEKVSVPSSAPPITLYSTSSDASQVVIQYGDSAGSAGGTSASATFTTKAAGFQVLNMSINNTFDTPNGTGDVQAVALLIQGDQTVLQNVRMHGYQDTLYINSINDQTIARTYIRDSFIEGDTDFIFGRGAAVIQNSTINYLTARKTGGAVFAPSTHVDQDYGFLVLGCEFTVTGSASNSVSLGRSWDTSSTTPTPNGQTVVRESVIGGHIRTTNPWAAAATSGREFSATGNRFSEYCNSGPGAG